MSFVYFFAGEHAKEVMDYQAEHGCNILRSYVNDQLGISRWIERRKSGQWKDGLFLIDSGAFTAHTRGVEIDIDEYIKWLNERDEYIDYFIVLDKIPGKWGQPKTHADVEEGAQKSWENYWYMRERVKSPHKLLPVFHQGENPLWLKKYLDIEPKLDYICFGGNKELDRENRQHWYSQCFQIIRQSSNPDVKVHCLGSGTFSDVELFPFYSMDSTTWVHASASAEVRTPLGTFNVASKKVDKNHIKYNPVAYEYVRGLCDGFGLSVERLCEDYKERLKFATRIYLKGSEETETTYYSKPRHEKRQLFD